MKRYAALILVVLFLVLSVTAMPVYAQDNVIDKTGDWFATKGKEEPEKSLILAQRRADRAAKRADKAMRKQSRQMEKSMKETFGR